MNRTFRSALIGAALGLILVNYTYASIREMVGSMMRGTLHVWTSSETIRSADLNANFSTVNTAATALITNTKVDSAAAIARSKISGGLSIPKAWGATKTVCTSGACTLSASQGTTSVTRTAVGAYSVAFNYTAADAGFMAMAVGATDGTPLQPCLCNTVGASYTTGGFGIRCMDYVQDGGAPPLKDCNFSYVAFDVN